MEAHLTPSTLADPQSDGQNLLASLAPYGFSGGQVDFLVQQTLSTIIRKNNWHVNVAGRGNEVIGVGSPSTPWLGLAVDIGTTKIAGHLVDLESGKRWHPKG